MRTLTTYAESFDKLEDFTLTFGKYMDTTLTQRVTERMSEADECHLCGGRIEGEEAVYVRRILIPTPSRTANPQARRPMDSTIRWHFVVSNSKCRGMQRKEA